MPGTLTTNNSQTHRIIRKYELDWISSAGGAVSGTTIDITGELLRAVFVPGTASNQPTDLYDVTLLDAEAVDVLAGQGGNLSNANTTHVKPGVPFKDETTTTTAPIAVAGPLELQVANAGNAKTGKVILYIR